MNDLLSDVRFWFTAMGLGLVGFVKYLWSQQAKRLDALEADKVSRKEFDQLRADLRDEHAQNSEKLDEIARSIRDDRQSADKHREGVRDSLEEIRTNIAVMQSQGLFDDAGRIRR